jgi:hypothetical protein
MSWNGDYFVAVAVGWKLLLGDKPRNASGINHTPELPHLENVTERRGCLI